MAMRFDLFLFVLFIGLFFYLSGYKAISLVLFIISVVLLFYDRPKRVKKAAAGYEMGEPIIIESTRNAPFRIPDKYWLKVSPKKGPAQPGGKFTKAGFKTFGRINKYIADKVKEWWNG